MSQPCQTRLRNDYVPDIRPMIHSVVVFSKFRSSYNRCIKKLFAFHRRDSMSGILMDLRLPTVDTVAHNSCVLFAQLCSVSSNKIVLWFDTIGVC